MHTLPLTGGDLRAIADALDAVEATDLASQGLLGRIEVFAPDGEEPVGWVTRFDETSPEMGWGYMPLDPEAVA